MRIKFKDKIYRLKEIESGVDSLMELVEEPKHKYKEGDFLTTASGSCFILKNICGSKVYDHAFLGENWIDWDNGHCCYLDDITGYCTPEERSKVITALKKAGKRWNAEKKCMEDIHIYKDGDFVAGIGCIFILHTQINKYSAQYHVLYEKTNGMLHYGKTYSQLCGTDRLRLATETEKQELLDALAKEGKGWNTEKKCIEDIPKCKFKVGDKVRIKDGISSKTHRNISPNFTSTMDKFIGKELTVKKYSRFGRVEFCEDDYGYQFNEDWLEPYSEEPKVGDWVIFWDYSPKLAKVGILTGINSDSVYNYRIDEGVHWMYAVKWDGTKEHLEEVRKDKI